MNADDKKGSALPAMLISILIGAFIGWIVGVVLWYVFTIFSPLDTGPPAIYQIAWVVFGAIGLPFLSKK